MTCSRRDFLAFAAALAAAPAAAQQAEALKFGPSQKIDFEALTDQAKKLASQPFRPHQSDQGDILKRIDYDRYREITQDPAKALYPKSASPVTFFHLGSLFKKPVKLYAWTGSEARELMYSRNLFEMPADNPANGLPDNSGFAGFRLLDGRNVREEDWMSFLGASYFRARGDLMQYGVSMRAIAIDTVVPGAENNEEFPDFTAFYIAEAVDNVVKVLALLDGPSVTGAFQFELRHIPNFVTTVRSFLFPRREVKRFGVAVPTSMYWYSKSNRWVGNDYRPEVHDSDGLFIEMRDGERIWRPLNNPAHISVSAHMVKSPKGYGLLQRERDYEAYQDDIGFEKRPNAYLEMIGDWGDGAIELIELPTDREFTDNVVAMFVPAQPPQPGDRLQFDYRIHWNATEPGDTPLARCTQTRANKGYRYNSKDVRVSPSALKRQVIFTFDGPALKGLNPADVTIEISNSRGLLIEKRVVRMASHSDQTLDVIVVVDADGEPPVDLRLFLKTGNRRVSETVLYQMHPEWQVAPLME